MWLGYCSIGWVGYCGVWVLVEPILDGKKMVDSKMEAAIYRISSSNEAGFVIFQSFWGRKQDIKITKRRSLTGRNTYLG
jgi:hypothetical protein